MGTLIDKLLELKETVDFSKPLTMLFQKIKQIDMTTTEEFLVKIMEQYNRYQTEKQPKDQVYNINISLTDYLTKKTKKITLPIMKKCYCCEKEHRDNCFICKGQIYYISNQIFTLPLNEYEITSIKGGNHLPFTSEPGNLTLYLEDKEHPVYKRIGSFNLFRKVYKEKDEIKFIHLDNKSYVVKLDENKSVLRIDGFGLPDYNGGYGDLFLEITDNKKNQDKDITNLIKIDKDMKSINIEELLESCLT